MKFMKKRYTLKGLSVCIMMLLVGCASNHFSTLKDTSSLANKTIVVVPYKGPPVGLINMHLGTGIAFGVVGVMIENAATEPKRASLCEQLNDVSTSFVPERILAEECVAILRNSSRIPNGMVILHDGSEQMDGLGPLIKAELYPFHPDLSGSHLKQWKKICMQWLASDPRGNYSLTEVPYGQRVALEVAPSWITVNNGKKFDWFAVAMRLVDPASGKILASNGSYLSGKKIRPLRKAEDMGTFVEDFRTCARQVSEKCLKKMEIIQ